MAPTRRLFSLGIFRRGRARREMHEELHFHLEARVGHLVARGMSPEAARAEAIRRLGQPLPDVERQLGDSAERKERRLDVRDRFHDFVDDTRYALRGLARRPGFTIVAVLTLAIGIGANTAIYSAVDALLLRSLPFPEPGRLMDIVQSTTDEGTAPWSYPRYRFFHDAQRSYGALAIHSEGLTTITEGEPERVTIEEVSAGYLGTLGVRVPLGTDFPPDLDEAPAARRVALISDALWQRRFNAAPDVVGRTLSLNNEPWEIAGVLPPGFRGLSGRAEALVNVTARPADDLSQAWSLEFSMIGRLKPGVTVAQAQEEAQLLGPRIYEAYPMQEGTLTTSRVPRKWTAEARPLDTIRVASSLRRSLLVLFGAVGMVLLIACVNLANLLVARALSRRQEIAVRQAIGAARGRLVRLLLTESLVLATLGGVASLVVAMAGTSVLRSINPRDSLQVQGLEGGIGAVGFESIKFDGRAMLFTFAVSLGVGILFGLLPAFRGTRADLTQDLKDGGSGTGRRVGVSRRSLVVAEVALALMLLAGSGLMIRSLGNLLNVNPGFDSRNLLTLRLAVPAGQVAPDSMPGFYDQVLEAVAAVPGVEHVALGDCPPLNNGCNGTIMTFADRPQTQSGNAMVGVHWVTPGWFQTLRVPLRRGRVFDESDRLNGPKVVLINEEAARRYFPGEDPIGKRVAVYQGGFHTGAEVIGIVGDVRYGTVDSSAAPDVYISYGQARISRMMIFARTAGDPSAMAPAVRNALRTVAPRDPIYDIRAMSARVATATSQVRFSAVLLALFAAVALSLAIMGIHGVMSFAVAQRTREIGIRMALGATRESVWSLILREGALLTGVGAVIGLAGAIAGTRILRSMLYEVTPTDPWTFAVILVVLAVAALLASSLPARRAAAVDPVIALRRG